MLHTNNNKIVIYFIWQGFDTSDKGGGATLVRLCLARVFFVRSCVSARLQLQQPNTRRQIAPHFLSGGQQMVVSAGATLDFLVQHFISRNPVHLLEKSISLDAIFIFIVRSVNKKILNN